MRHFLFSWLAVLLWLLPSMDLKAQSNEYEAIKDSILSSTTTLTFYLDSYQIMAEKGLCFSHQNYRGTAKLTTSDFILSDSNLEYYCEDLKSAALSLPQLEESVPDVYRRIQWYYNNFTSHIPLVTEPVYKLDAELTEITHKIDSCIVKLKDIANASKSASFNSASSTILNSDNNSMSINVGTYERALDKIPTITRWSNRIEEEIADALTEQTLIYDDLSKWIQGIIDTYKPIIEDHHSQITNISENLNPDMTVEECEATVVKCNELADRVSATHKELREKMSGAMVYNPWGRMQSEAEEYYEVVQKCNSNALENIALKLEVCQQFLSNCDFPQMALDSAWNSNGILEIPSELDLDGKIVLINEIEGTILPLDDKKTSRTNDSGILVVIPESVGVIKGNCFYNQYVKRVVMKNTEPPIQYGVNYYKDYDEIDIDKGYCPFMLKEDSHAVLYVPDEAVERYKESLWTYYFDEILPISDSAVDDITINPDDETSTEIYNLNGIKVGNSTEGLSKGIYIMKKGGRTSKVMIP